MEEAGYASQSNLTSAAEYLTPRRLASLTRSRNDQAMASQYSTSSHALVPPFAIITLNEISQLHDCNGSEVRIYLALAAHAGPDGDCWPGRRRLAEITGQSREHVSRSTSALEAAGLIEKSQTPTGRTIYHLPLHRRPLVSEQEPTPCQTGHPPMPDPAPITDQTTDQEQREADPAPFAEPTAALSQEVLHQAKVTAPETVPDSWIEQGRALRPDLDEATIKNSALIFLDTARAQGRQLVDWQAGFAAWLRRERTPKGPKIAHKPLATPAVPSPYASPNYGKVVQETAQEAAAKFAAQMARYGAVPGEGGTWTRPGAAVPVTPQAPAPVAAADPLPSPRRRLTAEQTRRLAELAAAGIPPKEVAAALGRG